MLFIVSVFCAAMATDETRADRLFATHFSIWGTSWILEHDPQTGAELNRFAPPVALDQDSGLAYDGVNLYFHSGRDEYDDTVYKLNPNDGTLLGQYTLPHSWTRSGLAVIGQTLFASEWHPSHNNIEVIDLVTGEHQRTMTFSGTNSQGTRLLVNRGLGEIRGPDALLATATTLGEPSGPTEILELDPMTAGITSRFEIQDSRAWNVAQGLASIGNEVFLGLHVSVAGDQIIVFSRDGVEQRRFSMAGSTGVQALAGGPDLSAIPEPATAVALAGLGAMLLARAGWRRRRRPAP
jgi:hypothetical protein